MIEHTAQSNKQNTSHVEFRGISKIFPGVKALSNISFEAEGGHVYAIVGENGAGKSTLLKIMNGDYQATSGEVLLDGKVCNYTTPKQAIDAGISIIYQERQIVQEMTVAENVFLGAWDKKVANFVDFKKMRQATKRIIDEFGLDIDPSTKVRMLSTAHQQMVEIMKAYSRNAKVIAFDEPTASLTEREIELLFKIIRKLQASGRVVFYVSHRMKEIEQIADKVIVFKDGKLVAVNDQSKVSTEELIRLMVGRDLGDIFRQLERNQHIGEVILEIKNLSNPRVRDVSFKLHQGEILGFSGLVGAGRTELMRSIYGIDPMDSGEIYLRGKRAEIRSPMQAIESGISLCPEDRKEQGILPNMSVGHNITVSILKKLRNTTGMMNKKKEADIIDEEIKRFDIKTPGADKLIVELSGGNQQKAIVARAHETQPDVIILDEPTKGIDVGSKSEFYKIICDYAKAGKGVILISSELPEVIGLSDRILVMRDGRITGEVSRGEANEEILLKYAMLEGEAQ